MPRYYFRTTDGKTSCSDDTGLEFPDAETARAAALRALPEMALDRMVEKNCREFSVEVSDERGRVIYEASFNLTDKWEVT